MSEDFVIDDEYENINTLEYQLENTKVLHIGYIDDEKDVFTYMFIYKNNPEYSFSCFTINEPNYIERYDVFEIKLNQQCDFAEGFQILGCPSDEIEYVELFVKLQEKKPRSLVRFDPKELNENGKTLFCKKGWKNLPVSFLKNKPEYFLEIQLKEGCKILEHKIVKVQLNYLFMSNDSRSKIENSLHQLEIGARKLVVEEKNLKLI